jgi:long-subunit acyl-CoA synthetase (AMP-forming)
MPDTWTLHGQIQHWATERGNTKALIEMAADGTWQSTTWAEYWQIVRDTAKGLIALGLQPGDGVALVGDNRREWVYAQHGIGAAGGVPAPIYTTNTIEQVAYIVKNSGAKIAICDNQEQLDKYLEGVERGLIKVDHIVTMDAIRSDHDKVISLSDLQKRGQAESDAELDRRLAAAKPDDLALLIYTSGTTGVPKGAKLTHHHIDFISESAMSTYPEMYDSGEISRYISYLPLCHAAEQAFTNFLGLRAGSETYFCPDLTKVKDYLVAARPQVFFAVPRVWEKFEAALVGKLSQATGIKAKLAAWARNVEFDACMKSLQTGKPVDTLQRRLANRLVISKIKAALGLDQLILAGSGAAPIARSTLDFFASIGILIHEGYGMTETTGLATVQPPHFPRFGTVGKALPGVEVRIADDGEVLLRGDNMIDGYLHLPSESEELKAGDGWMHTGDLGAIDADGFLSITGRKKDLLITAGGKNVAPAEMENHLQGIPGVGQAVVVGDRQPYLCALLILDEEALPDLCKEAGVPLGALTDIAANEKVLAFLQDRVEKDCNTKVARYQTIKKFEVLPNAFSVEGGELTPTMKVKRNVVNEKYASIIDTMYAAQQMPEAQVQPRA